MKKCIIVTTLAILIFFIATIPCQATSKNELVDKIYGMGEKYGMTAADKIKLERYVREHEITDDQCNRIVQKAQESVNLMEQAGVTNYKLLDKAQKDKLKTIAAEAANVIGAKIVFTTDTIEIYDSSNNKVYNNKESINNGSGNTGGSNNNSSSTGNGKLIEKIYIKNTGKLPYTGNEVNYFMVIIPGVVIIALSIYGVKKHKKNI